MTAPKPPSKRPPAAFGVAGRALHKSLTARFEFDEREAKIVDLACRQADDVAELERAVKRDGVMIRGAVGQSRLNAAVTELRQSRLALARLLGELALPDEDGPALTAAGKQSQQAAQARWSRQNNVRRIRDGATS